MLTLQSLLSLPVFLSTTLIAHALARPEGLIGLKEDSVYKDLAASLTGGEKCNENELKAIREGFYEMNELLQAVVPVNWEGDAAREFFGKAERVNNYTMMIESNLRRASLYSTPKGNATHNPDIHIRCDDPSRRCNSCSRKEGRHIAYNIGNEPHINFCRRYFGLNALDETVEDAAKHENMRMEIMAYYNRATVWVREIMHISAIGTAVMEKVVSGAQLNNSNSWMTEMYDGPMQTSFLAGVAYENPNPDQPNNIKALKYAYGATRAKLIAVLSTQEPYDAPNNPENYALYAQAQYVIEKKGFYPNRPVLEFDSEAAVLANDQLQEGPEKSRQRYACYDSLEVMQPNRRTNTTGDPITSSAPSMERIRSRRTYLVLFWTLAYWFALSRVY
ncbi:hypothetical protein K469DRAFT_742654 [Zopfia rhizophila CBS 207.26]|uniref:Uncharacterized protein n=1 Tax=Zopfia rhizophila CBS 207.26 TaxID=1314779 RepID=A0A6A6DFJ4_9PEZI|nr:hypothetical protein K469DRAFT_742654 [Zopfia rhizophila CBS 207.26]